MRDQSQSFYCCIVLFSIAVQDNPNINAPSGIEHAIPVRCIFVIELKSGSEPRRGLVYHTLTNSCFRYKSISNPRPSVRNVSALRTKYPLKVIHVYLSTDIR